MCGVFCLCVCVHVCVTVLCSSGGFSTPHVPRMTYKTPGPPACTSQILGLYERTITPSLWGAMDFMHAKQAVYQLNYILSLHHMELDASL